MPEEDNRATGIFEGYAKDNTNYAFQYLNQQHEDEQSVYEALNKQNCNSNPSTSCITDGDLPSTIISLLLGYAATLLTVGERMTSKTPVMILQTQNKKLTTPIAAPRPHGRYTDVQRAAATYRMRIKRLINADEIYS